MPEKLIFEYSLEGKKGYSLPEIDVPVEPVEKLIESRLNKVDYKKIVMYLLNN